MWKSLIVITLVAAVAPAALSSPVYCGIQPNNIIQCLGSPKIISNPEAIKQCKDKRSECERLTCIFKKSGWMDAKGYQVKRPKVIDHFEQFAKDHTEWGQAVHHVNSSCLSVALPAQGRFLNCPAYDVLHCALTGFYRYALPSQWSTAAECTAARQFAAACPVCPEDCFAPTIPSGSCNACRLLPTAPTTT